MKKFHTVPPVFYFKKSNLCFIPEVTVTGRALTGYVHFFSPVAHKRNAVLSSAVRRAS
jgi:hypothetical protein